MARQERDREVRRLLEAAQKLLADDRRFIEEG
jgi:hypothetical protein